MIKSYKNKNWLEKKYILNGLSTNQIAELCGCDQHTILTWMKNFGIKSRNISEAEHLAQANHCNLSQEAEEWIDGELLGDGCIRRISPYSGRFRYASKYLEYIQYVSDTLKSFGIKRTGKINKKYHKKMNCYTYHYASLSYPELLSIRKRWYPKGKKIIPRDLKLTPLVLRQEHIGDGCLIHYKKNNPAIVLSTDGFTIENVNWFVNELNKLGFKSTRRNCNNTIHISTKSTKDFLSYIGECPVECYQYKFNY